MASGVVPANFRHLPAQTSILLERTTVVRIGSYLRKAAPARQVTSLSAVVSMFVTMVTVTAFHRELGSQPSVVTPPKMTALYMGSQAAQTLWLDLPLI